MVPPKKTEGKPEVPRYNVDHDGEDGRTRIILHKHHNDPHPSSADKAVSAFFENWEEPIVKWEPMSKNTTVKRPDKRYSVITRNPDAGKSFVLNEDDFLTKGTQSEKWPFMESMETAVRDEPILKTTPPPTPNLNSGKADQTNNKVLGVNPVTVQPAAIKPILKMNPVPPVPNNGKAVPVPNIPAPNQIPLKSGEPVPKSMNVTPVKPAQGPAVPAGATPKLPPVAANNANAVDPKNKAGGIQPEAYFTVHAIQDPLKTSQTDQVNGKATQNKNAMAEAQQVPKEIDLYGSIFLLYAIFSLGKSGVNGRVLFKMDPRKDFLGQRNYHDIGDNVCPSMVRGIDFLRDPKLNKGMAFTLEERQALGIHGLLPPRFKTQEEQVRLCKENVDRYHEDLNKHIYLVGLQDRNERLFYRLIAENVEQMMPLVYTPTVGLACQKFGLIFRRPRGLFITIHDKGHVYDVLKNWPENDVRAIVVTDGERILGLGDLGAYGMGIPVGKLSLYTALAGIKPNQCLPILLDVGTNTPSLLNDPYYIGLNHKRVTGPAYDEFLDEFMQAVVRRYGQNTLIQFEDFANHNAFRLLEKYRDKYCTFNDDIQGTAAVVLAGVLASLRITNKRLVEHKFLFLGAGEAATGIANLILQKMVKQGATVDEAASRIVLSDANGLLCKTRPDNIAKEKQIFLKDLPHTKDFAEMVRMVKPTAIFGAAACRGAFNEGILRQMAELNERPIVFALSNPTSKAECTAEEAYDHTDGRAIFASGSPFPVYEKNGRKFVPGQGNNAYIFPGIALATIAANIHHISEDVFLLAAQTLADTVCENDLKQGRLYPPLQDIKQVSLKIAKAIVDDAYAKGYAFTYPEPKDKMAFLQKELYDYLHADALPQHWDYPEDVTFSRH